jgi:hypothetical protein
MVGSCSRMRLKGSELDILHVNVDFPRIDDTVGSDHKPFVAAFNFKKK